MSERHEPDQFFRRGGRRQAQEIRREVLLEEMKQVGPWKALLGLINRREEG
ncbi:MAG: hypothetical protein ABIZ18_05790 [Caldimonas sp.]